MTSRTYVEQAEQRLNKLSSQDFDNIEHWKMEEAINKFMTDWIRRTLHGNNLFREGDEGSQMRVDDLQILLNPKPHMLSVWGDGQFVYTDKLPTDYRAYKKLTPYVSKGDCTGVMLPSILVEEANTDIYLFDHTMSPSFEFEQCFHTMVGDTFRIYHNNDFTVVNAALLYYRKPAYITVDTASMDTDWEWKDDVAQILIDGAISVLAGDTDNNNAEQRAEKRTEQNN